ncbi:MAG TPA: efflux RND transporter periplasmic adaptor subunit [Lacunisphaera sp.]|jgi:Cu(I)/Ag(I) efflux system membrane fusion protein
MKIPIYPFLAALLVTSLSAVGAVYQCPMHPWIKSDHPGGKCTVCGMDLVEASSAIPATAGGPDNLVTLNPAAVSVIGVETSAVRRGTLVRTLRVAGVIEDDDTRHRILAARVPGRVEKLFVNYVGAEVREGAPLATIYSPEMLTAQRTYVERLRAGNSAFTVSERSAARERLLELGLTEKEIIILEHTLEPTAMVNIHAPMSGTVVSRAVYEGQYVQTNDRLFEIGDFSSMWFVFDAHENDLSWLRTGQTVEIVTPSQPGRVFSAPVAFIDPNLNEATRTVRVRVVLPNADRALLHKQTALGLVHLTAPNVLLVPRTAVLQHTGLPLVFMDHGNHGYEPRELRLGRIGDVDAEILSGAGEGDRVVTTSALLIDAQSQLARAAITDSDPNQSPPPHVIKSPALVPAITYEHLKDLSLKLADAATALAADDLTAYRKILPDLRTSLAVCLKDDSQGSLARFASDLPDRDDLKTARRDFEPFSTTVADLAQSQHVVQREKLHVYQCPMTPVLGIGRWLSREAKARNPFFGSAMPECGDEVQP